ncbi:hypothetical protein EJ063_16490 [Vibrio aquaticus]|uniref:Lipoprotein n=1 Tax=Vibrio aquaticus TaxID=2496559 RepID=A0A432CT29_9VIBR|nr:hypothetical protein [Vibrio aquaticus]RTZ14513.1 hypothetical protein EJ063_16490 [Vibrio aquaticus]
MRTPLTKPLLLSLLTSTLLGGCSLFSAPEREPDYPTLGSTYYSSDDTTVIESDNVLKTAIKNNRLIAVSNRSAIEEKFDLLFAEVRQYQTFATDTKPFTNDDLKGEDFHKGLETLIKQFSCELYASQQSSDSVQLCPLNHKIVDNNLGYLPFQDGRHVTERLSTTLTNSEGTKELDMFLRSTHERPLESLWGGVHELGSFKGSELAPTSLVLTVNLSAHKKESHSRPWQELHDEPLILFVVLPSVERILTQRNEVDAMNLSYQKAQLLIVDSR